MFSEFRHCGIGSHLINFVLSHVSQLKNCHLVYLHVLASNNSAIGKSQCILHTHTYTLTHIRTRMHTHAHTLTHTYEIVLYILIGTQTHSFIHSYYPGLKLGRQNRSKFSPSPPPPPHTHTHVQSSTRSLDSAKCVKFQTTITYKIGQQPVSFIVTIAMEVSLLKAVFIHT